MTRDLLWLAAIALTAAGITMMHRPSALIYLGLCCAAVAYFGRGRTKG